MASGVINVLNNVNTGLVLANTAGTVIVPLVKTIVQSIKGVQNSQGEMDYEIVLKVAYIVRFVLDWEGLQQKIRLIIQSKQ